MRYKRMGRMADHRVSVPMLSGGIHADIDATLIEDNELAAAQNMEWRDGALRTRKALRAKKLVEYIHPEEGEIGQKTAFIDRHPTMVDGKMYALAFNGARTGTGATAGEVQEYVSMFPVDGDTQGIIQYKKESADDLRRAAIIPCDKDKYNSPFLLYSQNKVYRADEASKAVVQIDDNELYAPLVLVNGESLPFSAASVDDYIQAKFAANGVMYEGFNALTARFRAQFTSSVGDDADIEVYVLPRVLKSDSEVKIEIATTRGIVTITVPMGTTINHPTLGDGTGSHAITVTGNKIFVKKPFPKSVLSGNVTVTGTYAFDVAANTTTDATIGMWFGGTQNRFGGTRVFLSGFSGKNKSRLMWSDVNNPLYFPESNYMDIGDLSQGVTALDKQEDMLVIFKEREMYYTRYVEGGVDADTMIDGVNVDVTVASAYFPLYQLSPYIGCDAPGTIAVCRNRLVWMCQDGRIYTLMTANSYSERNVREIGAKIRSRVLATTTVEQRAAASAADYGERYYLMIGNRAFVFHYADSGFVNQSSFYSDKRAAERIAWFEHRFDGFYEGSTPTIISDGGDQAVVITTKDQRGADNIRVIWHFTDETADTDERTQIANGNYLVQMNDIPIKSSLTTKQYTCGNVTRYKRVKGVYLSASAQNAAMRTIIDGKDSGTVKRLNGDGDRVQLIIPGVKRCRTLGLSLESELPLVVTGLYMQYINLDVVR